MHILGGFWVGLVTLILYFRFTPKKYLDHSVIFTFLLTITAALAVGLMWEIFEYAIDRIVAAFAVQLGDTLKDLCNDLTGGLLAALVFVHFGFNKKM